MDKCQVAGDYVRMRIAMVYGRFCSGGPNAFDIATLYQSKGLTGSESYFFNTARGLAERGHEVQVFCDCAHEITNAPTLSGASTYKLENATKLWPDIDVVLAWNEPDLLRMFHKGPLRVCVQQLNDFHFCMPGYDDFVDLYAFPSQAHRKYMMRLADIPSNKAVVMPNSINLEFYEGQELRRRHSVAYCSSPDRGLHWLLEYWPHVRREVPDAQLRIYYKVESWLAGSRELWYDHGMDGIPPGWYEGGFRARYVIEALNRLGRAGENGVILVGPTPNTEMARELMRTEVLAYTCDTLRWTEGFSVTIMDACAATCIPLISDVDAIGEVYGQVAHVIPGRPTSQDKRWVEYIVRGMIDENFQREVRVRCKQFVAQHSRQIRAKQWEELLQSRLAERHRLPILPPLEPPAGHFNPIEGAL